LACERLPEVVAMAEEGGAVVVIQLRGHSSARYKFIAPAE
jgi:hypothetical protein